ncbi:MAG: hypothetical protein J6S85_22620 [Methanobrevibacter sp.]|nr:hypothetical protein [Methanobrevibacter sp.]
MKLNKVDDKTAYENLLVKYAELENKIADIKANCDLAIEGRDIKIKGLELELTVEKDQHQEEINLHLHAEEYNKSLEEENNKLLDVINGQDVKIADLEKQIEKMKLCANCKWLPMINETITACQKCNNKNKWQLRR